MTRALGVAIAAAMTCTIACGGGRLRMPSNPTPDDNTLDVRVRTALANAPDVHPNEVQVQVAGAVVTLKGEVHGDREMGAAVAAARSVAGVKDVKSEMKAKP
jgi:osmotically-inducible protein OsmY